MSSLKTENKVRESNFELLRIIAMFMVLILHADFVALGAPDYVDITTSPIVSTIKVLFETLCIVGVNVFVLISGWFGIKPSIRGFSKFTFQLLFFSIGVYAVLCISGYADLSFRKIAQCFVLTDSDSYWFIPSYICLYLFAPILNSFVESTDKRTFACVVVAFYIFQTFFAFLGGSAKFILKGFSALSFMGLYLLAAYVRRYVDLSKYNKNTYLYVYISVALILTILYLLAVLMHFDFISDRITCYSNPLVVLASISLLIFFSKQKFYNKIINKVGLSCFAVYLFHSNPNVCNIYISTIQSSIMNETLIGFLKVVIVICFWFFLAILLDQVRALLWNKISKKSIVNNNVITER